jgi:undecaprenyl-diphosphatase
MLGLDDALLRLVQSWRSPFLDVAAAAVGDKWAWAVPLAALLAYSLARRGRHALQLALVAAVLVLASDLASNSIKGGVQRNRPERTAADVPVHRPASYSFPSGAATNSFALASYWSTIHPELSPALVAAAAAVGWSRIYLGDHYPSDVIAGAILGGAFGFAFAAGARRLARR